MFFLIDGTAPPETKKQQEWKLKRERIQNRIERLGNEMIQLHLEWQKYDEMQQNSSENMEGLEVDEENKAK